MQNDAHHEYESQAFTSSFYRRAGKRMMDIGVSFVALLLVLPLLMGVALLLRFCYGPPVLFRQSRCGQFGNLFTILKFRTMSVEPNAGFQPGQQGRITRIGRVLRKSKLDELPQLWNVLLGHMSLVGPRPEVEAWVLRCPVQWQGPLSIKPGITDWASIELRHEETELSGATDPEEYYESTLLPKKLSLYNKYVDEYCLAVDLRILLRTIWVVIR